MIFFKFKSKLYIIDQEKYCFENCLKNMLIVQHKTYASENWEKTIRWQITSIIEFAFQSFLHLKMKQKSCRQFLVIKWQKIHFFRTALNWT